MANISQESQVTAIVTGSLKILMKTMMNSVKRSFTPYLYKRVIGPDSISKGNGLKKMLAFFFFVTGDGFTIKIKIMSTTRKNSKPPVSRDNKTERPIKEDGEETCKFSFRVYWDDVQQRWFLPHQQNGNLQHCGHSHFESKYLRIKTKNLSQEELKLATDCFDSMNSATATGNLLNHRNDIGLEWHQLQYLKTKKKNDMVIRDMDPNDTSNTAEISSADRALVLLKNDPKVSFTALTAELNSGLITLKRRRKGMNNSITIEEFTQDLDDGTDSPQHFAAREFGLGEDELKSISSSKDKNKREVPKNLRLKNGQVLLALAWTKDESRRKFDMFPEVISGDATEETNSEERPLYTLMGKDNMNKAFAHTWCFMPSNSRWAYSWFFQDAVPTLHPGTATKRVKLILTDACPHESFAIANLVGEGRDYSKVYPNAHHRWCGWHRINRNFTNHADYKSLLARVRNSSVNNAIEVSLITRLMWYCVKHYETKEEVDLALKLINQYLKEDQTTHKGEIEEATRSAIRDFFTTSFEYNKHMLFEGYFENVMTFGNCTTGISEAEHRAYKKSVHGPRPADDLAVSASKLLKMTETKDAAKCRSMTHQIKSKSAKASDREKKAEGLSDYANKKLLEEHSERNEYLTYRPDQNLFYIKKDYEKYDDISADELEAAQRESDDLFNSMNGWIDTQKSRQGKKTLKEKRDDLFGGGKESMEQFKTLLCNEIRRVAPRFERTTIVEVRDIPGSDCNEKMLVCTRCFKKRGYACKHIYKLVNRYPVLTDAHVRWQKSYAHYYGVSGEMSKHFQDIRDKVDLPGIPITEEDLAALDKAYPVRYSEAPEEYFLRSLPGKLRLRGSRDNNHWKSPVYYTAFEGVDPSCFACDDVSDDSMDIEEDISNMSAVENESQKLSGLGAGPCGASQVIQGKSSYQVPSELTEQDGDSDDFALGTVSFSNRPGKKVDAFHDFMPMYQEISKLVDATGGPGVAIVRKYYQQMGLELRQEAYKQKGNGYPTETAGMQSGPQISNKRSAKRKKMATSPSK